MIELVLMLVRVDSNEWEAYGIAVASGTVSVVIDGIFLLFYLSMVRRMKAEVLWESSLACWLGKGIRKVFVKREVTVRVLILFSVHLVICFVPAAC